MNVKKEGPNIEKLTSLMERLRGPDGCPWDREQTLASLVPFIIEEAYEVVAAIDSKDMEAIKDELGDLLFQIIFASRIAGEEGSFDLKGVIDASVEKMVRRHPHVFGDQKADTSQEVLRHWAEIKKAEKRGRGEGQGILSGIPEVLPALLRAHKVSKKAARIGFDWQDVQEVFVKVDEELEEFKQEVLRKNAAGMEEEFGDLLFSLVNVSRFIEVNPEDALRKTISKFISRFSHIEKKLAENGEEISSASMEDMDRLWKEAKALEKKRGKPGL
ncbi:MAG: nucleoside triphosphate pyrophosphohydrolase [Thermodesulfobacteriota bacterium]